MAMAHSAHHDVTSRGTRSLRKVLAILEMLSSGAGPIRLTTLARCLGLPKATVHRLLHDLVGYRLVVRVGQGYVLGEQLFELAQRANGANLHRLKRLMIPFLMDLHERTRAAVSLGVLNGRSVSYVETVYDHRHAQVIARTAELAPAHCTSAGKVLIAHRPDVVDALAGADLSSFTPATITDVTALRDELDKVRHWGVAYGREEYLPGVMGIAAPIGPVRDRPIAAISIAGIVDEIDPVRDSWAVRNAARAASAVIRSRSDRFGG